ncbi:helix-turn-helix domain-containing protein [Halorubrum amylolyticum]
MLGDALGALPEWLDHEVRRVGPYRRGDALFDPGLTDRQFEAVAAAVDVGYYDGPGAPGVDAVADALGCAESTAAEHLRKAERAAMTALVDLRRPP